MHKVYSRLAGKAGLAQANLHVHAEGDADGVVDIERYGLVAVGVAAAYFVYGDHIAEIEFRQGAQRSIGEAAPFIVDDGIGRWHTQHESGDMQARCIEAGLIQTQAFELLYILRIYSLIDIDDTVIEFEEIIMAGYVVFQFLDHCDCFGHEQCSSITAAAEYLNRARMGLTVGIWNEKMDGIAIDIYLIAFYRRGEAGGASGLGQIECIVLVEIEYLWNGSQELCS
jgi:hypothetical protein